MHHHRPPITDLWFSTDHNAWEDALHCYWCIVPARNISLEESLNALDLDRLRRLDAQSWYNFLKDEYFRWKYTDPRRLKYTRGQLQRYEDEHRLDDLDQIRTRLLTLDTNDVRSGLKVAQQIHGLGTAGASGLLALMYPHKFGTVDQFLVTALRQINGLPEAEALTRMKPEGLTIQNGVLLVDILRRKAADNNRVFGSDAWTPRKVDMVLWTYGR